VTRTAFGPGEPERQVVRQAIAGMLWSKQYYGYDVEHWPAEHGLHPLGSHGSRNSEWFHLVSQDVISMPDTWEYPWFAAWDLAFHAITLGMVDVAFAKGQLDLLLSRRYLHPNGQTPAYEWNFSDVNPPCTPGPPTCCTSWRSSFPGARSSRRSSAWGATSS
jgi:hypothetical protein